MSWLPHRGGRCPHAPPTPFGPLRVPSELMHPIAPVWSEEHQRWLKRYRLIDPINGAIGTEVVFPLYHCELVKVEPMKMPLSTIFDMSYKPEGVSDEP